MHARACVCVCVRVPRTCDALEQWWAGPGLIGHALHQDLLIVTESLCALLGQSSLGDGSCSVSLGLLTSLHTHTHIHTHIHTHRLVFVLL